jgi:hypothetical protein
MKYSVEVYVEGTMVNSVNNLTKRAAASRAKAEAEDSSNQVYVTFYRAADGQHGYLNRDGNHEITGKMW